MSTLLHTTAFVLAFPTSMDPPSTVKPKKEDTLAIMKANAIDLIIPHHTNHSLNEYCNPYVKSSGLMIWAIYAVAYAPVIPAKILNTTNAGIMVTNAVIFGIIRKRAGFTPIISRASICWVTRIVPSSDAMFEPALPASIRHIIEDENSSNIISRVVNPVTKRGIHGDCMFNLI